MLVPSPLLVSNMANYVNTLIMADFNLFWRAIQGDTHRFESKKGLIEVRKIHLHGY